MKPSLVILLWVAAFVMLPGTLCGLRGIKQMNNAKVIVQFFISRILESPDSWCGRNER